MTESYQGIFTLSVLCFNKNAKFSVMNAPYKRPNNSDPLYMVLGFGTIDFLYKFLADSKTNTFLSCHSECKNSPIYFLLCKTGFLSWQFVIILIIGDTRKIGRMLILC